MQEENMFPEGANVEARVTITISGGFKPRQIKEGRHGKITKAKPKMTPDLRTVTWEKTEECPEETTSGVFVWELNPVRTTATTTETTRVPTGICNTLLA